MSKCKKVLVSYLERKKTFEIAGTVENDLEFLTSEVMKSFSLDSNAAIDITFQKFDDDWQTYLDLETDYVAEHKDHLKIVVTPVLLDKGKSSQMLSESSSVSLTQKELVC